MSSGSSSAGAASRNSRCSNEGLVSKWLATAQAVAFSLSQRENVNDFRWCAGLGARTLGNSDQRTERGIDGFLSGKCLGNVRRKQDEVCTLRISLEVFSPDTTTELFTAVHGSQGVGICCSSPLGKFSAHVLLPF